MSPIDQAANTFSTVARWCGRHMLVVLAVAFLLCCGLLWLFLTTRLERRYATIRAAGQPVTLEELNDYYAIPAGAKDNTALWLSALGLAQYAQSDFDLEKMPIVGDAPDIPPVGEPWPEREMVVAYLDDQAEILTAIHRAADEGGRVRYPQDLRHGVSAAGLPIYEIQAIRHCSRLLALEAHVRCRDGDLAGAIDSLHGMFAVARTLERYPLMVSFFVQVALDGMALEYSRQLITQSAFSSDDLQAIQFELRQVDYAAELQHALIGERALALASYDDLTTVGFDPTTAQILRVFAPGAKAKQLDLMSDVIAAANKPWHEILLAGTSAANWQPSRVNPSDFLVEQVFGSIDTGLRVGARQAAYSTSFDAAITVELFRRDQGKLPETLSEVVPQYLPTVPVDPFDGESLRYIIEENGGFVVYSVGEDCVDDQGDVELTAEGRIGPDYGVRFKAIQGASESK